MNPTKKLPVSVQRVLNPRSNKTSMDIERELFDRTMFESLHKAINQIECPPKEKHVRKILIGTYQTKSAIFFWDMAPLLKLQENSIICWKFCHVLHKLLRDGHSNVIADSYPSRQVLVDCGRIWANVDGRYGALIRRYCQLLYNRLKFHARNPQISNDLKISDEELESICECDVNIYFQFICELFDSLDDILGLQQSILNSLEMNRASSSSLTTSGQCRLAPLVACIQDSSMLYDYTVKLLFKLHSQLPPATLDGHRQRFLCQFQSLKQFYINASNLQYFKSLIQVPLLSEKPPNFLIAADLNAHVTPRVILIDQPDKLSPDSSLVQESSIASGHNLLVDLSSFEDLSTNTNSTFNESSSSSTSECLTSNESCSTSESSKEINEIERLNEMIENLNTELAFEKFEKARTIDQLTQKINSLQVQGHEIQQVNIESESEKISLELKISQQECTALRSQLGSVQAQNAQLAALNQKLTQEAQKLNEEISQINTNYRILNSNYDLLEAKYKVCEEKLSENLKSGERVQNLDEKNSELICEISKLKSRIQDMESRAQQKHDLLEHLPSHLKQDINPENLEEILMKELNETDSVIKNAALRIEQLGAQARQRDSGVKLEVNEKIADVCSELMKAVLELIQKSRYLQDEISATATSGSSGGGNIARREFYKRNSNWTQGLISAANVVAVSAKCLVDAADRVMNGTSQFNELVAAAHEIAASTTQLVVGSKVKACQDSLTLKALVQASKIVNTITGNVVATAKQCSQIMVQESVNIDVANLTLHQTKKMEMESQVRLLDLENQITKERIRLGILRKQQYNYEAEPDHPH